MARRSDKLTNISKQALKDFYSLHLLLMRIDANSKNGSDKAKHDALISEGKELCRKWMDSKPAID